MEKRKGLYSNGIRFMDINLQEMARIAQSV
jgi:hypothetical protein